MGKRMRVSVQVAIISISGTIIVAILTTLLNQSFIKKNYDDCKQELKECKKHAKELERDLKIKIDDVGPLNTNTELLFIKGKLKTKKTYSLDIMGTNALSTFHMGRELIIETLNAGWKLRILLLDPTSDGFLARKKFEKDSVGRLDAEFLAFFYILFDIIEATEMENSSNIELRLYQDKPLKSLLIVAPYETPNEIPGENDGIIFENVYPTENGRSGFQGNMFLFSMDKEKDKREGKRNLDFFKNCWERGLPIKLPIKKNQREEMHSIISLSENVKKLLNNMKNTK